MADTLYLVELQRSCQQLLNRTCINLTQDIDHLVNLGPSPNTSHGAVYLLRMHFDHAKFTKVHAEFRDDNLLISVPRLGLREMHLKLAKKFHFLDGGAEALLIKMQTECPELCWSRKYTDELILIVPNQARKMGLVCHENDESLAKWFQHELGYCKPVITFREDSFTLVRRRFMELLQKAALFESLSLVDHEDLDLVASLNASQTPIMLNGDTTMAPCSQIQITIINGILTDITVGNTI
ncbi:hypothetical protein Ciccas_011677 [Cichlidogyrus casuarinus]|uniref:Uncharacterized protein n=1 Tax=Cichlidogyrus casuarinus TaxID=1844966 RepID=A0ABD2PVE7_9PLAT